MASITNRDIDIFLALRFGVSTYRMLKRLLNEAFGYRIFSDGALLKRLSRLKLDGFIERRKIHRKVDPGNSTIYALSPKAVRALVEIGCLPEEIRAGIPKDYLIEHELAVSSVLHIMEIERNLRVYSFYFKDASVLKREPRLDSSSRPLIPDLELGVSFSKDGRMVLINITAEIDRGTILASKMGSRLKRLSYEKERIIVFCRTNARIHSLSQTCRKFGLYGRVHFMLTDQFYEQGFRGCNPVSISGNKVPLKRL